MEKYLLAGLLAAAAQLAPAAAPAAQPADKRLEALYFSAPNPGLTRQEKAAIAIANRWRNPEGKGVQPVAGADGTVRFLFGAQQPSVVCAVLQVCDIELQAGEQVNSIHLGDAARWTVEPAITGQGPSEIQHLVIKPMDVGLETSLIVTTDRRTYHLRLRSHRSAFMPRVGFTYPEEALAQWDALKQRASQARSHSTLASTGEYLGNLSFAYEVTGAARWKPVRVYNDGRKTIIEMPRALQHTEAPALLVVRKDGGLFQGEETGLVNYRVQGDRYIVDAVFDKAVLVAGVGRHQDRVTITREP